MKGLSGVWISKVWWVHGLRGLFALLYGVYALFQPGNALTVLIYLFGVYALADGLFALLTAFEGGKGGEPLRTALAEGLTGIVIGTAILIAPHITQLALLYIIAVWAGLTGLFQIFTVDKQNRVTLNHADFVFAGIVSILIAGFLLIFPELAMLMLIWCLGAYMLLFGALALNLARRLYKHEHRKPSPPSHLPLANSR